MNGITTREGEVLAGAPLPPTAPPADGAYVRVTVLEPSPLVHTLLRANASVSVRGAHRVEIRGMTATEVAVTAAAHLFNLLDLETVFPPPGWGDAADDSELLQCA